MSRVANLLARTFPKIEILRFPKITFSKMILDFLYVQSISAINKESKGPYVVEI